VRVIVSFRHKGLERLYRDGSKKGVQAAHVPKLLRILSALDVAQVPDDLSIPSFRTHRLKGDLAGHWSIWVNGNWRVTFRFVDNDVHYIAIKAIDPATGKVTWEHRNATFNDAPRGGILATAGGLVFSADTTSFIALNAATGEQLWSFLAGGTISTAPISYRIGDRQAISVVAGQMLITFALPDIALQTNEQRK